MNSASIWPATCATRLTASCDPPGAVALHRHHAHAVARGSRLHRTGRDIAVVAFRREHGDGLFALLLREFDDAVDVALDQEGEQVDAMRRHRRIGGEGDERPVGGLGDTSGLAHARREQRPENEFRALADGRLRRVARAVRRAVVVLDQNRDVIGARFGDREIDGVAQRGADDALARALA